MSKDRAHYLAADRYRTKVGKQRKALAEIADAAVAAIAERNEGRSPGAALDDLERRVRAIQAELQ